MRQVLEEHSPSEASMGASALGREDEDEGEGRTDRERDEDEGGGGDNPVNEGAVPGRPPVARWMRDV